MADKQYNFIDLFAGCGGLSEGFYKQGFKALAHVEIDPTACQTLRTRMRHYGYSDYNTAVIETDITRDDIIDCIEESVAGREVDIIIGGPPCQAYSSLGRAKDDNAMQDDPRNYLFESYVKVLNHFLPKFFVFENVTGMLTAKIKGEHIVDKIVEALGENYKVKLDPQMCVLNSANYGVPQIRKRVIIIGVRNNINMEPEELYSAITKTHYDPEMSPEESKGLKKYVTVRDAIEELPALRPGEGEPVVGFEYSLGNEFLREIGSGTLKELRDHVARNHNETDMERYSAMAQNHWTFQELLENRADLRHEKARVFGNSYVVQWWDLPSKTIIAHLYKDGNQFIHPDYKQGRTFTVREAARIQSFPDDFVFEGPRTEQFKQIGNAVPPLFAEAIAIGMKKKLDAASLRRDIMIFKPVGCLKDKSDEAFFRELAKVYTRLVEVFCQKQEILMLAKTTPNYGELKRTGVIDSVADIEKLKKILNQDYSDFINAVNFAADHKSEMNGLLDKVSNDKRRIIQENTARENHYSLVDFFCGAGGLSLGFVQEGFNVMLANDIEDVCIHTYQYNHPELPSDKLIQGDIKTIVDHIEDYVQGDIDIVVGGPPCQGFSEANRQRVIDDPRNKLYKYYVQAVEKIAPKFVLMENVKGMLKVAGQVVEDYERLRIEKNGQEYHYRVGYQVLNSQDFSVAQSRERLIYIAIRNDIMEQYHITPDSVFEEIERSCENHRTFILQDALDDIKPLDAPRIKNMNEVDSETTGKKIDINEYSENNNDYLKLINTNRYMPYTFNHKARYVSDVNYEIYKRLNPGDDATDEKIADIMPYAHRNHCFKDKYYKLHADRPCRTITAHLRMDCHSHIHPSQIRALTPREAARVQSFPDDYLFLGPYLKTYMQIGNAVPPMMARGIAAVIKNYLGE